MTERTYGATSGDTMTPVGDQTDSERLDSERAVGQDGSQDLFAGDDVETA